jgi:hypothetical protein
MEKVKIKTCIDTGRKTKDNKPVYDIELVDGRKGGAFDALFAGMPLNEDIEIDINPAKDYNGEKRFYFNIPGDKKTGGKFPQKDWTFEKKKASLELAINWCANKKDVETSDMIKCAHVFFDYLNRKES